LACAVARPSAREPASVDEGLASGAAGDGTLTGGVEVGTLPLALFALEAAAPFSAPRLG
jgi:hypothetical protein